MPHPVLEVSYATAQDFLTAFDDEVSHGGLLVRGRVDGLAAGAACVVLVIVPDQEFIEVEGRVEAVARFGVSVTFDVVPESLKALAHGLREPVVEEVVEAAPTGTIAQRLAQLTVAQKMSAALSGDRETRIALLRDVNKAIHVYVFRNPRIGLDEVQWAAKMTTLSPDALKLISEHKEWGANATVCIALVRNPRTPLPVAMKILPRVNAGDLRAIAKGGARDQLVHAARKMVSG